MTRALRKGATAVHFLPKKGRLGVHYREYGLLSLVAHEPAQVHNYLLARIAALGGPVLDGRTHARGVVRCPLAGDDLSLDVTLVRRPEGISITIVPRQRLS